MKTAIAAMILGVGMLSLAQPKPAPKTPVISDALKAELFKAEAQATNAQLDFEHAQQKQTATREAFQKAVQKLTEVCGKDFHLQLDTQGDPVCVAVPETKK